jgi:hypothetical protein
MEQDKEIAAMQQVSAALASLDNESTARVIRWAAERYSVGITPLRAPAAVPKDALAPNTVQNTPSPTDIGDLYSAADPSDDGERVLVVAYWYQTLQGEGELDSQRINGQLKDLGHGISHMPHVLDGLMSTRPRLMIQLKKQGRTRQARQKFKLTAEGIKKVQEMIRQASG